MNFRIYTLLLFSHLLSCDGGLVFFGGGGTGSRRQHGNACSCEDSSPRGKILRTRSHSYEILKENTSLTDGDLKEFKLLDIPTVKDATFAKEKGIVHEINYLPIPEEMNIFNVDY
jgi:hypothetical protein